ncbi:MAG TPA: hypothetical protein VM369_08160 [Candidatus Binatia bacterium]|nr:hypothetical protein [Candidatus Binatia bacterium]
MTYARPQNRRILWLLLAALSPPPAAACSTCACGDNTITLMGAEKPFSGRLRSAVEFMTRSESMGAGVDREDVDEQRLNFGASYSFNPAFTLGVVLPVVEKRLRTGTGEQQNGRGLGDADLLGRVVLWQDTAQLPRHMAGLRAGVRLPTSQEATDASGAPLEIDAQPDAGATAPNLGAWYGYYAYPFFLSASATYYSFHHGRQGFDPGETLIGSLTAQYGFPRFALQLGVDARHASRNAEDGVIDPDSGGTMLMGFGGAVLRLGSDFLVSAGVQVPVLDRLNGVQEERTSWRAGLAYDF